MIFNTFFETLVNAKCEGHNFGHSYIAPTIAAHTKLIIYTCNCIEKDIFRFYFKSFTGIYVVFSFNNKRISNAITSISNMFKIHQYYTHT